MKTQNSKKYAVIWKWNDPGSPIRVTECETKKEAEMMVLQLLQNPKIDYANISDCVSL